MNVTRDTVFVPIVFLAILSGWGTLAQPARGRGLEPGEAIEYKDLAISPEKWKERNLSTRLIPWEGERVVFLTTKADFDRATMGRFVGRLDAGWKLYADLVGQSPRPFKQVKGKPSIAAIPDAGLTCGYGCGYVGATGIEVAGFYQNDYPLVARNPKAFPHYYFYEMGRNYYLFEDRHSSYVTGYAVFMRYVCMDALGCEDTDADTRRAIERAEERYAAGDLSFLKGFTTVDGLDEKAPRLKDLQPSDQPVLYASAMLKLRKDHGGDAWVKRFFAQLARCPQVKPDNKERALRQAVSWLVAASTAAQKDLTPVFVDRWRLPLAKATRDALAAVDWAKKNLDAGEVIRDLRIQFTGFEG